MYSYARAKTEIREIVENELKLKRRKSNARVARYNDTNQAAKVNGKTSTKSADSTSASLPVTPKVKTQTNPVLITLTRPKYAPIIDQRI